MAKEENNAPELSKYIKSESIEVRRSDIKPAAYNPRKISGEARKSLKRGIKEFGLVGGVIVNRRTGMTLVSGHQRLSVMDELQGYPGKDYVLRVDVIDVDERQEKTLNILLNNPNSQGTWDVDALAKMIPDIDYKAAGLNEADLSLIGMDYILQTEGENSLSEALGDLSAPLESARELAKEVRKAAGAEKTEEEKAAHMREVKREVREKASEKAENMDAYVMLSFDTYKAKAAFLSRFGYPEDIRFVKGEEFDGMIEMS